MITFTCYKYLLTQKLHIIDCIYWLKTVILLAFRRSSYRDAIIRQIRWLFIGIMMYKKIIGLVAVLTISCVAYAFSDDKAAAKNSEINKSKVTELIELNTRLKVVDITPSRMPNVAEVMTDQGLFYASFDGSYFIAGKVYRSPDNRGLVDLAEDRMAVERLSGVKQFENDMIVYKAKDEKHVITVFTDITCGYCRKMHSKMSEYNDLGITVRYLAYPRSGINDQSGALSQGFQDLRSIWCHENPAQAMTKAKAGSGVAHRICDTSVEDQFNFGRQSGVNGTPAIILENGQLLPGFREPDDLAATIANM